MDVTQLSQVITPSRTFDLKASADDGKEGKVCDLIRCKI